MAIKKLRDVIYQNYYSRIGFTKENSYYLIKLQKKNLLSFATKSIKIYYILVKSKNTINLF